MYDFCISPKTVLLCWLSAAYAILLMIGKVPAGSVIALEMQHKLAAVPLPTRAEQLKELQEKHFDILVIGGGATGCGVALDAASRGQWDIYK